jgi:tRNA pseudouridine55 synthase
MEGIANILKPPGMSSHDVVEVIRAITGEERTGHAGTLDPAAAGVLPVFVGRAVRIVEYVMEKTKSYRVLMVLGVTTPTADLTSEPSRVIQAAHITREMVVDASQRFLGEIEQEVPQYSAVQIGGRRLYKMARNGEEVPSIRRSINISSLEILSVSSGDQPQVRFDVTCSKGTYIRTLCEDIGNALGVGGAMSFLIRTKAGHFDIESSVTLEEARTTPIAMLLMPTSSALSDWPRITVSVAAAERLPFGIKPEESDYLQPIPECDAMATVYSGDGRFLAVASVAQGRVSIKKVLCQ